LYPESNGIIGNRIFNPITNKTFDKDDDNAQKDPTWWGGEPIWITAVLQKQISGVYFWPVSEARLKGVRADYIAIFDFVTPWSEKIDHIIDWLQNPLSTRPTVICVQLYDGVGDHSISPTNRTAVSIKLAEADTAISYLLDQLKIIFLKDQVNIVITSDHGMTSSSVNRVIVLDDYFNVSDVTIVEMSPVLVMFPNSPEKTLEIYQRLVHPNLTVYLKDEIPPGFHYKGSIRAPPILGIANEGWSISTADILAKYPDIFNGGAHGYIPTTPSMRGIFVANGPDFAKGEILPPFENVNIYSTLCKVLGLVPAPNNGSVLTQALAST